MTADTSHEQEPLQGTLDLPGNEGEPRVLRLSTKRAPQRVEKRVPLFYIDDVAYTVIDPPAPTTGLRYLWLLKNEGEGIAQQFMLEQLLGKKGYVALINYKDLTDDEYQEILRLATKIMTGNREAPKGRRNGSRALDR